MASPEPARVVSDPMLFDPGRHEALCDTAWDASAAREAVRDIVRDVEQNRLTSVESNIGNPTNEALWAAPGTMVAAWHLWQATGEQRWCALFQENVDQLWRTWPFDAKAQCHLWTQDMYGKVVQSRQCHRYGKAELPALHII